MLHLYQGVFGPTIGRTHHVDRARATRTAGSPAGLRYGPAMRSAALLLLFLGAGCQDHTTGVQTLCNAPRDCQACQGAQLSAFDDTMAKHIERSVRNDEARELFEAFGKLDDKQRAKLLREAAEKAGLSSCILADRYHARAEAWEAHQEAERAEAPAE